MMSTTQLREVSQKPQGDRATTFPAMLEQFKGEIARALPKHMNADRMARIALTAFRGNAELAKCDPRSVFGSVVQSSQLGLEIGLMGEAFLVPFSKSVKLQDGSWGKVSEAQLIPGWQGLIKLARNSGLVKDIYAHEVREKDEFVVVQGLERSLIHKPLSKFGFPADDEERGPLTGFYAVAVFKDGSTSFVAMSAQKVNRIRDRSNGYKAAVASAQKYKKENTSPWVTDYEAMGLKTAVRALCKWMPKSPELAAALALDEASDRGQLQKNDAKEIVEGTWAVTDTEETGAPESSSIDASDKTDPGQPAATKADEPAAKPTEAVQPKRTAKPADTADLDGISAE